MRRRAFTGLLGAVLALFAQVALAGWPLPGGAVTASGYLPSGHYLTAWQPAQIVYPRSGLPSTDRSDWAYWDGTNAPLYKVPLVILFGSYPWVFTINSGPPGLTVNLYTTAQGARYYAAAWTPSGTVGTSYPISITANQQDGSTPVTFSWTVTTTSSTSHFIFVDGTNGHASGPNGGTGTGTFSNPFVNMNDWFAGATGGTGSNTVNDTTYLGECVYYMTGTYNEGVVYHSGNNIGLGNKPRCQMAYPGQSVTFDGQTDSVCLGLTGGDAFIQGITFLGPVNAALADHVFTGSGPDTDFVFFENTFDEPPSAAVSGSNPSLLFFSDNHPNLAQYISIIGNIWEGNNAFDLAELYYTQYGVIEGNDISNLIVESGDGNGFYWKLGRNDSWSGRANAGYIGETTHLFELDNYGDSTGTYSTSNIELTYNNFLSNGTILFGPNGNTHSLDIGPVFMGRNTWGGSYHEVNGQPVTSLTVNGDVYGFTSSSANADGFYIHNSGSVSGTYTNMQLVGLNGAYIDGSGNLLSGYSSYLGTRGHQIQ